MKINAFIKRDWIIFILLALPFLAIALYWDSIPEKIPMHWNFSGDIDRWETKLPGIFYIPMLSIFLYLAFLVIPKFDPKRKNYFLFSHTYQIIKLSIISLLTMLSFMVMVASIGIKLDIMYWVIIPIILLFIIIGNTFGTIRQNWFIGIRVPWTMMNEEVWMKTHRMAGHLWVWSSVIMLLMIIILNKEIIKIVFWIYFGLIIIIPIIYSYILYKRIEGIE